LILGAGASKDFGFPTGRELVGQVCDFFGDQDHQDFYLFKDIAIEKDPRRITEAFPDALRRADPPSVDIWLEHNPEFIWAGKVAIAIVLLRHERRSNLMPANNWYQVLFDRLDSPFDQFQNNRLIVVTFNYDRSLEQYFFDRFRHTHTGKSQEEYRERLRHLSVLHIYGSLGRLPWRTYDSESVVPEVPYGGATNLTDDNIIAAAKSIQIMGESASKISGRLQEFQELMKDCKALYFLGFGYHELNMQRLGINTLNIPSKVMGTAQGLSYQRMKEIERLNIRQLRVPEGLFHKSIYDFLHKCVDFNEGGYPPQWVYQE
jgi:hypothetical protein